MKKPPYLNCDPQEKGPQYLEDLATGYWFSEVLFTAIELDLFSLLASAGKNAAEIAAALKLDARGTERFLQALCSLGLVTCGGQVYYNTKIASEYLVQGKANYQGNSILWRKYLAAPWGGLVNCLKTGGRIFEAVPEESQQITERISRYIDAMDNVARTKTREILPLFNDYNLTGNILDVGAGSGAISAGFLEHFAGTRATLMDLPDILNYTGQLLRRQTIAGRITLCPANILDPWPAPKGSFDLVILSNVLHAYAEDEAGHVLGEAEDCLKPEGLLVIHDFFLEHYPEKAALFDLNMLINTYNGKVFTAKWVSRLLAGKNLYATDLIPLTSDTGVLIATKNAGRLAKIHLHPISRLAAKIKNLGFINVTSIAVEIIHIPDWADQRCQYGCAEFGRPRCPPNSPAPARTREMLKDYSRALLLEGEPPTRDFQRQVLAAEKEAFQGEYYKAFAFWAGPCSLCQPPCAAGEICRNPRDARPSMEGAGIDVFATVRRAGFPLRPLREKDDYIKYFALLLLE
jgi:predicted metal-binding protein/ubiquinone/menaquinone biosynthesis C-methylase UbiE